MHKSKKLGIAIILVASAVSGGALIEIAASIVDAKAETTPPNVFHVAICEDVEGRTVEYEDPASWSMENGGTLYVRRVEDGPLVAYGPLNKCRVVLRRR